MDIGTDRYLEYFESEVIDGLLAQGGATCKFIAGNYGSGKTHVLDLLHERALARGLAVVRTDLSQALSLEDWRLLTRHILDNVEMTFRDDVVRSLPSLLDAIYREGWVKSLTRASLPHPGFVQAMKLMLAGLPGLPHARGPLSRYLTGEPVTVRELEGCRVKGVKNSLNGRNAESVLRTVIGALHHLGVPGVLLLFDENEKTFQFGRGAAPPARVRDGANLLRRLIDSTAGGHVPGMAAVLTVLPTFVDACANAYDALGQRVRLTGQRGTGAWRWPNLSISALAPELSPEMFVHQLSARVSQLVCQAGGNTDGLESRLREIGGGILASHAGQDHRRYVSRALAVEALRRLEA